MREWFLKYWFETLMGVISSVLGGVVIWLKTRLGRTKKLEERIEGLEVAIRANSYDRLYYLHGRFLKQGWVSVADLANIEGIYDGYHALGGNGVGTKLYEDLKALPSYPLAGKKEELK